MPKILATTPVTVPATTQTTFDEWRLESLTMTRMDGSGPTECAARYRLCKETTTGNYIDKSDTQAVARDSDL